MRFSIVRSLLIAATAVTSLGITTAAKAASGSVQFSVVKGGWVIGASGGSGTLFFQGRRYPISVGGLSAGIIFGGSVTDFRGRVSNIRRPSDVVGVYGAMGAGAAAGFGAQVITLQNGKGAILTLAGRQIGLQINVDLSGMTITIP
jgi:hypothetical protein